MENSSKTTLNFSPLQCTYSGKKSFQYHWGLVKKLKSGYLELRLSVYHNITLLHLTYRYAYSHPRLPRGEAFRFTSFIDECSVTEWVMPGLPRMAYRNYNAILSNIDNTIQ